MTNREYILQQMASAKPVGSGLVCFDEAYNYYQLGIAGYLLMYRRRCLKPDSRRCFLLSDELAKALNFQCLYEMRCLMPSLQYWRRFVSVERLKIALAKYDNKWGGLLNDIG